MKLRNLAGILTQNSYPGRGVLMGRSACGRCAVMAYFIMGRSENSRNRVFVQDGEGIRTQAHDPAKLSDPSLIIYAPVRVYREGGQAVTIVTNGDQTDTIYDGFCQGLSFQESLRRRTFEPDAPNYTPRISGAMEGFDYLLSILKSAGGDPGSARRFFFEYQKPLAGQGHLIHTYKCDGDPIPSFEGEPVPVALGDDIEGLTREIWEGLDPENKVSLFVRFVDVKAKTAETRIINKHSNTGGGPCAQGTGAEVRL